MSDAFQKLCAEVLNVTKFVSSYEECCLHFQPVLEYIQTHLEERNKIAETLIQFVEKGGYAEVALLEFLMDSLQWPEIKAAAEKRCAWEGNMYNEVKHLVDVFRPTA